MPDPNKPPVFNAERLACVSRLEQRHFWFVGRQVLVDRLVDHYLCSNDLVLDAGCGTGFQVQRMHGRGIKAYGLDLLPEGITAAVQKTPGLPLLCASAEAIPLSRRHFNIVIALDVLEHLDDRQALAGIYRILKDGGLLLATVPAMPWLWSYRDQGAGHLRRYTPQMLYTAVQQAGFELEEMGFFGFFLFPLVIITRLLGRGKSALRDQEDSPSALINALFTFVNRLEGKLGRYFRWPVGSSLYFVCRKRSHGD